MENVNETNVLGKEKVSKLLRMFSIPCVLSLVIQALYNLVDQIFIGHEVSLGSAGNAATGIVYGLTVIALGLGLWLGDGTAACMSLAQGRNDTEGTKKSVGTALFLGTVIGIVLTAVCLIFKSPILKLLGGDGDILVFAKEYSLFIFLGFTFYILGSVINPIIRADGSPKFAMLSMALGAIVNIILDPIFLYVFKLGMTGAALATFVGQLCTFVVSAIYLARSKTFKLTIKDIVPSKDIILIIKFGVSSFLTQFAIFLITLVNNVILLKISPLEGNYGVAITQGAITLAFKVFGIIISIVVGIAAGGQPIIGYNYGAGHYNRVKETLKYVLISTVIVGIIATIIFEACPSLFLALFGDGGEGIDKELYSRFVNRTFRIYLSCILLICVTKVLSIFFQSIGSPVKAMLAAMMRDVVFLIPSALILGLGSKSVDVFLWSSPIADVLGFILAIVLLIISLKNLGVKEPVHVDYAEETIVSNGNGVLITIAREHGAKGREIAREVAKRLMVPYYDKNLAKIAADESGLSEEYMLNVTDGSQSRFSDLYLGLDPTDIAKIAQRNALENIAKNGSAVIVGRAADYVLKEYNPIKIFIYADEKFKIKNVMNSYNDTEAEAYKHIKESDKNRSHYYEMVTGKKWKNMDNYDFSINSSIGIDKTVDMIVAYINTLIK